MDNCIFIRFSNGHAIIFFDQIDVEHQVKGANLIFSVAKEFYNPLPIGRLVLFSLLVLVAGIILYYYSNFKKKSNKDNIYYKQIWWWIISFIAPFLLLIFYGMFSILNAFNESLSAYFFSFFSFTVILSILFRPKFLNTAQVGLAFIPLQKQAGLTVSSQLFSNIFFNDCYYLEKDASLVQLTEKLQTTETNLREYLQNEYGMGINDLMNKYRIAYMLELFKDPKNKEFTIEHLSQKAGFPSRSTMYRAFSKFHGGNPSDYYNN